MTTRTGVLSWSRAGDHIELELHREPCNEIGSASLEALERFVEWVDGQRDWARAIIVHSSVPAGFSAGADLRELHAGMRQVAGVERVAGVRAFLERMMKRMDGYLAASDPPAETAGRGASTRGK